MFRFAFNHSAWEPNNAQLFRVFACLSSNDQEKALKFVHKNDVKSYLAARLLTLYAAKRCINLDPTTVKVSKDDNGRPFLEGKPDFDFNLSHNGDFTLLTSCQKMRTGVDVMRVDLRSRSMSVDDFLFKMRSLFATSEWRFLTSPEHGENEKCLKEAFVKNIGVGLRMDVSTVGFDISGSAPKCTRPDLMDSQWIFEEHQLPNNHVAAVAWHHLNPLEEYYAKKPFQELSLDDLLHGLPPLNAVSNNVWSLFCHKEAHTPV